MSAHTTIVGGIEPLALGEHYTGVGVERDGEFYQVQEFVVLRHSSLTEWLQQVWERGKSLTPSPIGSRGTTTGSSSIASRRG